MKLRTLFFIALVVTVFAMINIYIAWNGLVMLKYFHISVSPYIYGILYAIVSVAFIIGRMPRLYAPLGRLLKVIGAYYIFILEFMVIVLPVANGVVWILSQCSIEPAKTVPIVSIAVLTLFVVLFTWGTRNAWSPVVRHYEVDIHKKVEGFAQLHIIMASDFHLGNIVGKRHLRKFVNHVNKVRPDLVLLPGDVIDDSIEPFMRNRMGEVLGQLQAKYGVFAVLGNHEYYGKHNEQIVAEMSNINIKVLQDEIVEIGDAIYIVGRKDKASATFEQQQRQSISQLLSHIDLAKPIIVLDHQPFEYDEAQEAGVDLNLSGHTHRGQFFPNQFVTRKLFELDWGYLLKGQMHAIVSSGFGTWGPPLRIGSRSEIIEIAVRFQQ